MKGFRFQRHSIFLRHRFLFGGVVGLVMALTLSSCHTTPYRIVGEQSTMVAIDSTMDTIQDSAYLDFLAPVKANLQEQLDIPLGHAPRSMEAHLPESELLNWACDALYSMALEVQRGMVDFAVVNIGGIRCSWPEGDITFRHVFEMMPFDNRLVILSLEGKDVLDLCECFAQTGGQGVSRDLRLQIKDGHLHQATLRGQEIVPEAVYYIATSDYLSTGADHMDALTRYQDKVDTQLRIRDLYIQYIKEQTAVGKPVASEIDGRITIL